MDVSCSFRGILSGPGTMTVTPAPTARRDQTLDAVRGFAVLGILLMNIVSMGMPGYAYLDPNWYGGADGANLAVWQGMYVLVDGKMRCLFTLLFGAGILLVTGRAEQTGRGAAGLHYRRMGWLLLFGAAHGWLLWYGDILLPYALAGMAAFFARRWRPRAQFWTGTLLVLALAAFHTWGGHEAALLQQAAQAPNATAEDLAAWQTYLSRAVPPPESLQFEIEGYRGDFLSAFQARLPMIQLFTFIFLPTDTFWEVLGFMLIGMALYQTGFFTGGWKTRTYLIVIALGYGVAAPATWWLSDQLLRSAFSPPIIEGTTAMGIVPRPFLALAHASVVILIVKSGALGFVANRLAAVGQMALSNYLATTLMTTTLFYGYGFGLFGKLQRWELYLVVIAVWIVLLAWSRPWLQAFRFGPFEWLWRSLTYLKPQPFRRRAEPALDAAA